MTRANEGLILVACIGNIFLGDDAFGVEMARELKSMQLPAEVVVIDFGIRGFDLAYALLEPWNAVIFVDAIQRGGAPGDVSLLKVENEVTEKCAELDPHGMNPFAVLAMARSLGQITAPMYVVGCEPANLSDMCDCADGLSPQVGAALLKAKRMLFELIDNLTFQPATASEPPAVTLDQEE